MKYFGSRKLTRGELQHIFIDVEEKCIRTVYGGIHTKWCLLSANRIRDEKIIYVLDEIKYITVTHSTIKHQIHNHIMSELISKI